MTHHSEVIVDGRVLTLGQRIGKGGEGEVFAIGDEEKYAVKLYTTSDKAIK